MEIVGGLICGEPAQLCADPKRKFHNAEIFERGIGIRLNGKERNDVEECCVSERWVRVPIGTPRDRKGNPLTIKLKVTVEAYFRQ